MPAADDPRHEPATSVRNVGSVASLGESEAADADFATVDLCLFASLDAGERVLDPEPPSTSLRIERSKLAGLELSVQMSLRLRTAPTGARLRPGSGSPASLPAAASRRPATLHGLGFALVPDDELQAAQAEAGR